LLLKFQDGALAPQGHRLYDADVLVAIARHPERKAATIGAAFP